MKAQITPVQIGSQTIDGLMDDRGKFYVAVSQANERLEFTAHQNHASRQVKAILGKDFQHTKLKTEINPNAVAAMDLKTFEVLLAKLDRSGNKKAQDFRDSLVGLALTQLFSDAFGIKLEAEDRQEYLRNRETNKKQFHPLFTSWLKIDGCEGIQYAIQVKRFKMAAGLPLEPVTEYDTDQLWTMNKAEIVYNAMRKIGKDHKEALSVL